MNETSFSTLEEFYGEVKSLAAAMQEAGYIEDGKKIHHYAFELPWTTGSELLGELANLFEKASKRDSGELKDRIKKCEYFAKNHRKILKLG